MTEKPVRTEMPNAIELSIVNKFRKTIWTKFLKGIKEYELIQEGDKIAVCISGGKDSMLMAMCMKRLQRYSKVPFEVVFLVMNPGYNEINYQKIQENAALLNIPIQVFETGIFDETRMQVKNGIRKDEQVVKSWSSELYDGAKVRLPGEASGGRGEGGQGGRGGAPGGNGGQGGGRPQ